MTQDKKSIRKKMIQLRDQLTLEQQKRAEILITERLLGHQWYYRADKILLFVSYGSEISTRMLLEEAFRSKKAVYVPRIDNNMMDFYRINSLQDLEEGYKGIPEPKKDAEKYIHDENDMEHILMIMPGVAFDFERNRLGYGKGFYDRYLSDKPNLQIKSIAIGHQCQMTDSLPTDENDRRPYQVICV